VWGSEAKEELFVEAGVPPVAIQGRHGPDIHRVALIQKTLIYIIVAQLALQIGVLVSPVETDLQAMIALLLVFALLAAVVAGFIATILLALATRRGVAAVVLMAIGSLIPLIGLLVLLRINMRATRQLRDAGLHVGLMGVSGRALRGLKAAT
jgi:hypothetical protein